MKGTGLDRQLWGTPELPPEEKPGGFCLLCCESFETERDYLNHYDACIEKALEED